jgi:hypothetical protein
MFDSLCFVNIGEFFFSIVNPTIGRARHGVNAAAWTQSQF